jgi:hypothetical protein
VNGMLGILSGIVTLFFYILVFAAVWKLFQMATDLGEIKTILSDMRRTAASPEPRPLAAALPPSAPSPVPAGPNSHESAEALLREVEAESRRLATVEPPKAAV